MLSSDSAADTPPGACWGYTYIFHWPAEIDTACEILYERMKALKKEGVPELIGTHVLALPGKCRAGYLTLSPRRASASWLPISPRPRSY